MAIPPLVKSAERYFVKSLSTASQRSYAAGTKRYLDFCSSFSLSPFPVSEVNLSSFVSFLADQGLKHQTLKCYLSAVRSAQIAHGYAEPNFSSFPRLVAILNGIKRVQAESHISPRQRLPITPDIIAVIHRFLPDDRAGHMVWAACLTGFFGFLRTAEFTVPAANQYDSSVHLSLADVSIDNHTAPSVVKLTIKQSKTDTFRQGVDIFLGRTSSRICPVSALTTYLAERGSSPGPLFTLPHGSPLTRHHLVDVVKCCLRTGGLDDLAYNGHSFRIGAATTAAARGLEDSLTQPLGRWKSSAYLRYVRIPRQLFPKI